MCKYLLSILFIGLAWGQDEPQIEWFNTYGDSINEVLASVDNAIDKGYIVAGWAYGEVDDDFAGIGFLAKIDSMGNEEWINYYENIMDFTTVLFIESDSGYMAVGRTRVNDPHGGDLIVMKLDSLGFIDWTTENFSDDDYGYDSGWHIQPTDGGYIVAGQENGDIWILKISDQGDLIWEYAYGAIDDVEYATSIIKLDFDLINKYCIVGYNNFGCGIFSLMDGFGNLTYNNYHCPEGGNSSIQYNSVESGISSFVITGSIYDGDLDHYEILLVERDHSGHLISENSMFFPTDGNEINPFQEGHDIEIVYPHDYIITGRNTDSLFVLKTTNGNSYEWLYMHETPGFGVSLLKSNQAYLIAGTKYDTAPNSLLIKLKPPCKMEFWEIDIEPEIVLEEMILGQRTPSMAYDLNFDGILNIIDITALNSDLIDYYSCF